MKKFFLPRRTLRDFIRFTILKYHVRRAIALSIATALLHLPAMAALASQQPGAVSTGIVTVTGNVTVNGSPAISGQTLFSGSKIVTSLQSEASLDLGNFTRLELSAETELTLDFSSASISGSLHKGGLRGSIPARVPLNLITADVSVVTDSSEPAVFSIEVENDRLCVSVQTGRVEIRNGDQVRSVSAGQSAPPECQQASTACRRREPKRIGLFAVLGGVVATILGFIIPPPPPPPPPPPCVIVSDTTGRLCL